MNISKNSLRLLTAGTLIITAASAALAKPALRESRVVTQPDGTSLTIRLVGDEHAHLYLTEDGCPIVFDKELGYVYASVNADGTNVATRVTAHNAGARTAAEVAVCLPLDSEAVSEILLTKASKRMALREASETTRRNKGYGLCETSFPSTGEQKGLVILVQYQDVEFGSKNRTNTNYNAYSDSENAVLDYWNDMLNKEGFDGFGAVGSCHDWFRDNSTDAAGNPQFKPTFDVFGPVTLPHEMAHYGGNDFRGNDIAPYEMVIDACHLLDDQIDFSEYDRDGDGKVDNVYIFYAGLGEADYGGDDTVWPHSWDLRYAQAAFTLDGVTIDHYACSNETDNSYGRPDGIGTFVHEFSHVMGLPDLYTTTYNDAYTPGNFSVLDSGPYNNQGRTPPNYSAYERYALGWMEPEPFPYTGEFTLEPLASTNFSHIVTTKKDTEYFLLENRQQNGWDSHIPGHGMLIWHVDYVKSVFDSNTVNNRKNHQYVDLIEANEKQQSYYANGHPFPGRNNVTSYEFKDWNKARCGVTLSEIAESDEGVISFHVETAQSGIESIESENYGKDTPEYFNLQGIRIENPSVGSIVIRRTGATSEKIRF